MNDVTITGSKSILNGVVCSIYFMLIRSIVPAATNTLLLTNHVTGI